MEGPITVIFRQYASLLLLYVYPLPPSRSYGIVIAMKKLGQPLSSIPIHLHHISTKSRYKILFNLLSPVYDKLISAICTLRGGNLHESRTRKEILADADVEAHHRLLDVGIGTGVNCLYFGTNPRYLAGVDPSLGMLKQCAKRIATLNIHGELFCYSAEHLHFDNESFDRILCVNTLMFSSRPSHVVKEMVRVLAPAGKLVITIHTRWLNKHSDILSLPEIQSLRITKKQLGIISTLVVEKCLASSISLR